MCIKVRYQTSIFYLLSWAACSFLTLGFRGVLGDPKRAKVGGDRNYTQKHFSLPGRLCETGPTEKIDQDGWQIKIPWLWAGPLSLGGLGTPGQLENVVRLAMGSLYPECDSESRRSFADMETAGGRPPWPGFSRSDGGRAQDPHSSSGDSEAQPGQGAGSERLSDLS